MPVLKRRHDESSYIIIRPTVSFQILMSSKFKTKDVCAQSIAFNVNVQHDCVSGKCQATGTHHVRQERKDIDKTASHIVHGVLQQFVINTHGFHNAHRLRRVLDPVLIKPVPLMNSLERYKLHSKLAEDLHNTNTGKRAKAKEKRAETRKRANESKNKQPQSESADQSEPTPSNPESGSGQVNGNSDSSNINEVQTAEPSGSTRRTSKRKRTD